MDNLGGTRRLPYAGSGILLVSPSLQGTALLSILALLSSRRL